MIGNLNTNFSDVVFMGEMIESGVKLGKIEGKKAKKPTLKKKRERHTWCLTKEKCITLFTHDRWTGAINRTTNMTAAAHKGITNPTLGQWLVSLFCLH